MSIFIVGASGNIGQRVVRALIARGVSVTALVRDAEGELPPDSALAHPEVRLVRGDLRDTAPLRAAARGSESMFVLTPHNPEQIQLQNAAADLAADVGAHVVKVSSWGPAVHEDSPVPGARRHWITQQHIISRGLPHTFLCPNYFMQVLINRYAGEVRRSGVLVSPAGLRGISMVDAQDVADVAACVLTEPEKHDGRTYTLSGPAAVTYPEIAAQLSALLGREVRYHDQTEEEFATWMASENRLDWETDHAAAIFRLYREGIGEQVTDHVRSVTGHAPRTLTDFLDNNLHHFLTPDPKEVPAS
ncbi:NmrA family NAD(P)-binding protein [Streptomyces sp. NK08204]|uniref:NmrA family NAD(P)-binding protein n=1 Tax=Streptomyces sp. NK08204 TaxID=2873260 RepID=UPI001CED3AFB|nr:NmrA family NAD(P)-binding protein [Streptomyces sp. NK08204]